MPSRNMAIRDDVYRRLAKAKRGDESFSEVIERLLERRASLLPLWGALASSSGLVDIEKETKEIRRRAVIRA